MDLLVSKPGAIRVVSPDRGVPAGFSVDVEGMTTGGTAYTNLRAIVTGVGLDERAAVQITHALRDMVYVYTFGDRMGQMQLSGIALLTDCENPALSGFSKVYKYWRANRAGKRRRPLTVSLGTDFSVRGILTDLKLGTVDPALPLANFTLGLSYFPDLST